jgi:hypothetical protein
VRFREHFTSTIISITAIDPHIAHTKTHTMPRAVTRAISSSFAGPQHTRGSSLDLSSAKATSILDMFPSSPRPPKISVSSSKLSASSSSPSNRKMTASSAPRTPPKQTANKRKRVEDAAAALVKPVKMPEQQIEIFLANYDLEGKSILIS